MIKAIGQNGLNFIANKFKELKTLVEKKADKTEIITQEERKQVDLLKQNYVQESLYEFEKKLKAGADDVYTYSKATQYTHLFFAYHLMDGSLTIPSGVAKPYSYSYQKENINKGYSKSYCILHEDLTPFTLEEIQAMTDEDDAVCYVHKTVADFFNSCVGSSRALSTTNKYFVKQETGKVLSSNDYTSDDKAKVQNIPAVVDNLTTDDATKALSAKQGKALQDNKADKSNIGRCKTRGWNTTSIWQSVENTRDLEDWIGDFDKRTRELKTNKGLTGDSSEIKQQSIECSTSRNCNVVAVKWGRIVELAFNYIYDENSTTASDWTFTIPRDFVPGTAVNGVMLNGEFEVVPKDDGSDARMIVRKVYGLHGGRIAGNVMYLSRYR